MAAVAPSVEGGQSVGRNSAAVETVGETVAVDIGLAIPDKHCWSDAVAG